MTQTWRDKASCKGMDTQIFYSQRGGHDPYRIAKQVCDQCPVLLDCFQWIMEIENRPETFGRHGYIAGMEPGERLAYQKYRDNNVSVA